MSKDIKMVKAIDKGFSTFLNDFGQSSKLLAQFCDYFLNNDQKNSLKEEMVNKYMDSASQFLQFLYSKDVFLDDYGQYLAFREIQNKVASDDNEKAFILKLKTNLG